MGDWPAPRMSDYGNARLYLFTRDRLVMFTCFGALSCQWCGGLCFCIRDGIDSSPYIEKRGFGIDRGGIKRREADDRPRGVYIAQCIAVRDLRSALTLVIVSAWDASLDSKCARNSSIVPDFANKSQMIAGCVSSSFERYFMNRFSANLACASSSLSRSFSALMILLASLGFSFSNTSSRYFFIVTFKLASCATCTESPSICR